MDEDVDVMMSADSTLDTADPVLGYVRRSCVPLGCIAGGKALTEEGKTAHGGTFDARWRSAEVSSSSKWTEVHLITHYHPAETHFHDRKDQRP